MNNTIGVYELMLTSNNSFQYGDIFGVHHTRTTNLLHQKGGGYCDTLYCVTMPPSHNSSGCAYSHAQGSAIPYIAIETGQSVQ